ncbi:MAG: UMP kinase [Candidatus Anstonellales archaeon]
MMVVTLSLGGSVVNPEKPSLENIRRIARIFEESKEKLAIVVGGGAYAREYAEIIRKLAGNEFYADAVATMETKQNAMLLLSALKNAYPKIPSTFESAAAAIKNYQYVVMGGTIPGITTDTDAVLLAEATSSARLVNISNVSGVYDKDPSKYKDAKKYSRMSHDQLVELAVESDRRKAGEHFVFDMIACKLAARSKLELHFVSWKNDSDVLNAIKGKPHSGTVVK